VTHYHEKVMGLDEIDLKSPIMGIDRTRLFLIKEKISNPSATLKELSTAMLSKYGIKISHTRIADILRELKSSGMIREVIIPNENYFIFAFLEFSNSSNNFSDWRKTYDYLKNSPNVVMILLTDGNSRWKILGAFRSFREVTKWMHDFVQEHGKEVDSMNLSIVYKIHKLSFPHDLIESTEDTEGETG